MNVAIQLAAILDQNLFSADFHSSLQSKKENIEKCIRRMSAMGLDRLQVS